MPKKKKTLKQKMQADQRRQPTTAVRTSSENSPQTIPQPAHTSASTSFSLPTTHAKKHRESREQARTTAIAIDTNEYAYLSKDILKTTLLTSLIVIAELVMKFFFERG